MISLRRIAAHLLFTIGLTVSPPAIAQEMEVAVAGYAGDLLLLRLPDEADMAPLSMASRTLHFGNRDGSAGSGLISVVGLRIAAIGERTLAPLRPESTTMGGDGYFGTRPL